MEEEWGRGRDLTMSARYRFYRCQDFERLRSPICARREAQQRLCDVSPQGLVMLDQPLQGEGAIEAGWVWQEPHSGRTEFLALATPFQITQTRHRFVGGLAKERDRLRPVMRDLALERGGRPPKFGVSDFVGTACRAANGGGDAAPISQQCAVILGRNAVRRESGEMHRAPEAVTCRSEIMSRLCRFYTWI